MDMVSAHRLTGHLYGLPDRTRVKWFCLRCRRCRQRAFLCQMRRLLLCVKRTRPPPFHNQRKIRPIIEVSYNIFHDIAIVLCKLDSLCAYVVRFCRVLRFPVFVVLCRTPHPHPNGHASAADAWASTLAHENPHCRINSRGCRPAICAAFCITASPPHSTGTIRRLYRHGCRCRRFGAARTLAH